MSARGTGPLLLALGAAAALRCANPPAPTSAAAPPTTPTPRVTPHNAAENPEDIRARLPRPTPLDLETKFPPPQQPPDKEAVEANAPGEPDKLGGERPVLLDGKPFPERRPYDPKFPDARRTRFVSLEAKDPGDGTLEHPWRDLQHALCALEPGDRLVVASGIYTGAFRVGGGCREGTAAAPIQVFARHAFLKSDGSGAVLTVERAHWQLWEVQIALLDSSVPGLVVGGAGAHDVAVDQTHIYEGNGPALVVATGAAGVTVSNCHIHQSKGVRIENGARDVTLVNNHIHHNRAASVTVGGGQAGAPPASGVTLAGNRIHNDRGPGLELERCDGVTIQRNRLSNYRPDEDDRTGGAAVVVGPGCRAVRFESNTVMESSTALQIGAPDAGTSGPDGVSVVRNYLENRLTADATAVAIASGRGIRVANNVVDRYPEPFRIAAGTAGVAVANNLVLEPAVAFLLPAAPLPLFEANVYGAAATLPGGIGTGRVIAADWLAAHAPGSRVIPGVDLEDGDLARIRGFSAADAGRQLKGVTFAGKGPDVGVAEK